MDATLATDGSQQAKRVVRVLAKRSGVKGVCWNSSMNCWQTAWREGAKTKHKMFFVHRYMESSGQGYREADAEALRDSIAFRESLVKDGVVQAGSASCQAGRRGVRWSHGAWQAVINVAGKRINGGCFRPQDDTPEEIERARLAAVERRQQLELEHFQIQRKEAVDPSEMQKKRESGVVGVSWNCRGLFWQSETRVLGKRVKKTFPPKDMSDESIEAARLQAVQHRMDLERCCRDAGKAGVGMKRTRFNTHFLDRLHPEPRVVAPRTRSGLPYERLLVTPPEMKMLPRMRDLYVRWWIGRGWILSPDCPKRMVETGAAPGTEIFQGKSLSKHREPEDEEPKASSSAVPQPTPMDATPPTEGSQQGKCVVRVQAKQSGVKGVTWKSAANCWVTRWCEGVKRKRRFFFVHRYMEPGGKGYQEADAEALHDAIAFRESLVRDGVVQAVSASRQAGRRGVNWCAGAWRAMIYVEGKRINGGSFRPQDDTPEEIERARLAAVERRRQLELEHFQIQRKEAADPSEMQKKRESGVTGVIWDILRLAWRSSLTVKGKTIEKTFRPKDMSDESVEAARLEAVQHRRDLERCRDAGKASS